MTAFEPGRNDRDTHLGIEARVDYRAENHVRVGVGCLHDDVGYFIDLEQGQVFATGNVEQDALGSVNLDI